MDSISLVLKRFGDEESTLLDRYERLSFEVQLNQAILGRSLSEPATMPRRNNRPPPPQPSPLPHAKRPAALFHKVLKKLLKPILGRKQAAAASASAASSSCRNNGITDDVPANPKDPSFWKAFSRSVRV